MSALVTGASRGIGEQIALQLAEEGYSVTLAARDADRLHAVKSKLSTKSGQTHHIWPIDLGDVDAVQAFKGAPLPASSYDVLVNNAGVSSVRPFVEQSPELQQQLLEVNLVSPILLTRVFVEAISGKPREKPAHIIFISSGAALRGYEGLAVYSATKSGLDGFARSLARELGPQRIHVNSVNPGFTKTDMTANVDLDKFPPTPISGWIQPEAVADAVTFLVRSKNITGISLSVDNGVTV